MDTSTKLVLCWYIIFMFLPMLCSAVVFTYEHIRHGIHSAITVVFLGNYYLRWTLCAYITSDTYRYC